jgi:hypothetical protein
MGGAVDTASAPSGQHSAQGLAHPVVLDVVAGRSGGEVHFTAQSVTHPSQAPGLAPAVCLYPRLILVVMASIGGSSCDHGSDTGRPPDPFANDAGLVPLSAPHRPDAATEATADAALEQPAFDGFSVEAMSNVLARVMACGGTWPRDSVPSALLFRETYLSQYECMESATTCEEFFACDALREDLPRVWPVVGSCDEGSPGRCEGDVWFACASGDEVAINCGVMPGLTCGADDHGELECVPRQAACSPSASRCEGDVAKVCTRSGIFVDYDCGSFDDGRCIDCSESSPDSRHCELGTRNNSDYANATCRLATQACLDDSDCDPTLVCSTNGCVARWCNPDSSRDACPAGYQCTASYSCARPQ